MLTCLSGGVPRVVLTPEEAARRKRHFAKLGLKTQADVDAAIDRFIALGERAEARRDRAAFESPRYWKFHDAAVKHYESARRLMPPGS